MWARIISSALAIVISTCIQEWSTCWGKEVLQEGQCCSQPAQSKANVACFLHAHGLMHYLPCVSQQVPISAHFTSVSLFCSALSCPCCGCRYLSTWLTLWTWVRSSSQWAIPCAMSSNVFRFTIRSAILAAFATLLRESTCWKERKRKFLHIYKCLRPHVTEKLESFDLECR